MSDRRIHLDDWLLDDQLGQLSSAEREELAEAIRNDPDLAARQRRIRRVLEPLDGWATSPPPINLANRIVAQIAAHESNRTAGVRSPRPSKPIGRWSRGAPFSLREALAVAAVIAFFGLIVIPSMSNLRAKSLITTCRNNLAGIGRAVSLYAAANDDSLPQVQMVSGGRWLRHAETSGPFSPNSRSPYLLLRFRYAESPKLFVCPSCRKSEPMKVANAGDLPGFPDPRNCSYDSINVGGPTPRYGSLPHRPYMADANPLFVDGRFHRIDPGSNSPNHGRSRGQNVLAIDGSADWYRSPTFGRTRDNIWQAGTVRIYRGAEVQTSIADTFLVP